MRDHLQCFLVDDDEDDREIFIMALGSIDKRIDCRVANDGVEALGLLKIANELIPDYIFIDVNMPKMTGIECLRNIKSMEHLSDSKVFMYSTTAETSVLALSKELGAEEFIIKPSSPSVLRKTLSRIFKD